MRGLLDAHGGGYHPVIAQERDGDDHTMWSGIWVFAIVIIFFALLLIFMRGRDDKHHGGWGEGLAPILGAAMVSKAQCHEGGRGYNNHDGHHEHWDIVRDELREFGEVKKEMALLTLGQSREMDRYFYDQRAAIDRNNYDTLLGFKNSEVLGLHETAKILARVDSMERRQDDRYYQEKMREKESEINYLKTVMALQPRAPIPAYYPQYPSPCPTPVYECAPNYGYSKAC